VQCHSHDAAFAAAISEMLARTKWSLAKTALAVHTPHLGLK